MPRNLHILNERIHYFQELLSPYFVENASQEVHRYTTIVGEARLSITMIFKPSYMRLLNIIPKFFAPAHVGVNLLFDNCRTMTINEAQLSLQNLTDLVN